MIAFAEVEFGSPSHRDCVALRREVLRKPLGLDYSPEQLAAERSDICLAALDGAKVVGCLLLTPVRSEGTGAESAGARGTGTMGASAMGAGAASATDVAKMRQVAVSPERQGQGVGKKLVAHSEEWLRARGFREIVLSARETAIPFYLALNYIVEGDPFTEVGLPHRRMRKILS